MGCVAVTGVNGFVGRHLVRELRSAGHSVLGLGREAEPADPDLLVDYQSADLTRAWPSDRDLSGVVHLAGLSAVGPSFDDPQRYLDENGAMVVRMFEALGAAGSGARVLVVSSGAVYDAVAPQPLTESSPVGHSSPYVVSKLLVEHITQYYASRGHDTIIARPFNHIGPGQRPGFLVPDVVAAVRTAAASGSAVRVGDLSTRRDYTDVRDVVRAYRMLLEADGLEERIFNVCSGVSRAGSEIIDLACQTLGVGPVPTEVDPARVRPSDPQEICGSYERLRAAVGWAPTIDLSASLTDFVAADLAH